MQNRQKKAAVVVMTSGLEFDDRVRKVSLVLSKYYQVKIFVLQNDNKAHEGYTSYGLEYKAISLKSRERFPSRSHLALKMMEFYLRLRKELRGYDFYWYNETKTFIFPLLAPRKQIFVWDQHEIPSEFLRGFKRLLFSMMERKCRYMLHANPQRIDYLNGVGLLKAPEKQFFIHNYPDCTFIESELKPKCYDEFISWLADDEYVYLQGLGDKERYPFNTVSSIWENTDYKMVVVGGFDKGEKSRLEEKYPDLESRVFFAGMTDQLAIPALLKDSQFTVVLYTLVDPNCRYCEANRMYQAIALGVPLVVGCNESMKDVVDGIYGVSISGDGSDAEDLAKGVISIVERLDEFKTNCENNKGQYIWSDDMVKPEWINMES